MNLRLTIPEHPFTAVFEATPESHDGSSAFTFRLRFSETPRSGFSYKTPRDRAFTVTGGEVTKAGRLGDPRHAGWKWRGEHRAAGHHGLRRGAGHLHRGRQDAVQPGGGDCPRAVADSRIAVNGRRVGAALPVPCRVLVPDGESRG